jgi:hypothetical protein
VGQFLFSVTGVFWVAQRPGTVCVTVDCPLRSVPLITVGQWLEFRNPAGCVTRAVVAGIELADPPDPDRTFAVVVQPNPLDSALEEGAQVWSLLDEPGT